MLQSYKTLEFESIGIYKEKGSKFIAYSYPILDEDDFKNKLSLLKKKHHDARHFCYGYRLLANGSNYRLNDDGEPNNSAGKPILGQIDSFSLTYTSIVVIRYFGGTKLGVGGLIKAYKEATKESIINNKIITKEITTTYILDFEYSDMSFVMDLVKKLNLTVLKKALEISCQFTIKCSLKDNAEFERKIKNKLLKFKSI